MFKDYVAEDINNTFFNMDEFAELTNINGVEVSVVEDSERLDYKIKQDYGGLIIGDVLFYIGKEEYEKIPHVGIIPMVNQAIRYKGKACTIVSANTENGVYEIILQGTGG